MEKMCILDDKLNKLQKDREMDSDRFRHETQSYQHFERGRPRYRGRQYENRGRGEYNSRNFRNGRYQRRNYYDNREWFDQRMNQEQNEQVPLTPEGSKEKTTPGLN